MDVIANPIEADGTEWTLYDCSGHHLGLILESAWPNESFVILPERGCRLDGIPAFHASLNNVLTAMEHHVDGTCGLVGGSAHQCTPHLFAIG